MKLKTKLSYTNVQEHEEHRSQLHVSTTSPSDASEKSGGLSKHQIQLPRVIAALLIDIGGLSSDISPR